MHLFVVEVEFDGGSGLGGGVGFEVGLVFVAHDAGDEEGGEGVEGGVIFADGVVEAAAFDGDAVFGAFELGLEVAEILAGFEVGVAFGDDEKAGEGVGELALGLLEFLEFGGVVGGVGGVDGDFADGGAGVGDGFEGGFFEVGGAGDGLDEVGDEVGAALVDVLDLGPLGVGGLVEGVEVVVGADTDEEEDEAEEEEDAEAAEGDEFFHGGVLSGGRFIGTSYTVWEGASCSWRNGRRGRRPHWGR